MQALCSYRRLPYVNASVVISHAQESMETKTEMLEDVKLALPATTRVADMQKELEKKMGWEPTSKLERCLL